jgi:hypothetical protein
MMGLLLMLGLAVEARPIPVTRYADNPPTIDGVLDFGEWSGAAQIKFNNGVVSVLNDNQRLYVLIDFLGEKKPDANDYFWLSFDANRDGKISPEIDLNYGFDTQFQNLGYQWYLGPGQWTGRQPSTFSSRAIGFGAFFADGSLSLELVNRTKKLVSSPHRVWELAIDLKEIRGVPGDSIRLGFRAASPDSGITDEVPVGFDGDFSKLVEVQLAKKLILFPMPSANVTYIWPSSPIELTQAIQTRQNTMPLVQDKTTVARLYLQLRGATQNQAVNVFLYARKKGIDLPGSPLSQFFMAPGSVDRAQLDDTPYFVLPKSWTHGAVEFQSVVRDYFGNVISSASATETFTPKAVPNVWIIPINIGTVDHPVVASNAEITSQESYLKAIYPVPNVNFTVKPWQTIGVTTVDDTIAQLNQYFGQLVVAWAITTLFTGQPPFDLPSQVYGFTPAGGGISDPVWYGGAGYVARGYLGSSMEGTMAHEINHNLDRDTAGTWGHHVGNPDPATWMGTPGYHPDPNFGCGAAGTDTAWPWANDDIHEVGFDTRPPITASSVIRTNYPDIMSYCQSGSTPTKWISAYRWQHLFDRFPSATAAAALQNELQVRAQTVYFISGKLNVKGTGALNPVLVQPGLPTDNIPAGDYLLELMDAAGKSLARIPFIANFVDVEGNAVENVTFHFQIVPHAGTAEILLKHKVRLLETVLDRIKVSANAPQVSLVSPVGGEVWSGVQRVTWKAKDADQDSLTFSLLYSGDDGATWLPVANSLSATSFEFDTSIVPGSRQARIRVVVTDGFNTAQDQSKEPFTIVEKGPQPLIVQPASSSVFAPGTQVAFVGEATDLEEPMLFEDAFSWAYDGVTFAVGRQAQAILPEGKHEIVLTVIDSAGRMGTAGAVVYVEDPGLLHLERDQLGNARIWWSRQISAVLESSADINGSWRQVEIKPTQNETENYLMLTPRTQSEFFRLRMTTN